jgi:hypothetical protein
VLLGHRVPALAVLALAATGLPGLALSPAGAETVWLQATAQTEGAPGQQRSLFRAFTTVDQAGTQEVAVPRICVRGVGHEVKERCADNVSSVEVMESVQGLVGTGDRCVETLASAETPTGTLTATARACP